MLICPEFKKNNIGKVLPKHTASSCYLSPVFLNKLQPTGVKFKAQSKGKQPLTSCYSREPVVQDGDVNTVNQSRVRETCFGEELVEMFDSE